MFQIDPLSKVPVYEQIKEQLKRLILSGVIKPGEQIPSVRRLSLELSINPNTILKSYSELDQCGLICSVPGKGYFVCENVLQLLNEDKIASLSPLREQIVEMALAGIRQDEILRCVEEAFQNANRIKSSGGGGRI